jgi:hypothetical protein
VVRAAVVNPTTLARVNAAAAARNASLLRLSYLHGSRASSVELYPSGVIVRQDDPARKLGPGGRRGAISGFSAESRRRLKRKLVKLDFQRDYWQFVTLTYPGEYSYDPSEWKRNLKAYRSALERDWSDAFAGAVWRLEQQTRGAPHYHLLICWRAEVPRKLFRTWTRETWTRILAELPRISKWVRTRVDTVEVQDDGGVTKLMHYLSKYLAKVGHTGWLEPSTGELMSVGRYWGEWGALPYCLPEVYLFQPETLATLVRRLRRLRVHSAFMSRLTIDRFQGVFWGAPAWWRMAMRGLSWDSSPP